MLSSTKLNFKNIRSLRQRHNITKVYNMLKVGSYNELNKNINKNKLKRVLLELNKTSKELFDKCVDDDFCKLLSINLAKIASRQGIKDEHLQLETCNNLSSKYGIHITKLGTSDYRPVKMTGSIASKKDNVSNDKCLKSFDGKINGHINGYITAKIVYGSGGHQDNVFQELYSILEWWKLHQKELMLIVLIDTDLKSKVYKMKQSYNNIKNIKIFNHIEFQEHIINNFKEN